MGSRNAVNHLEREIAFLSMLGVAIVIMHALFMYALMAVIRRAGNMIDAAYKKADEWREAYVQKKRL